MHKYSTLGKNKTDNVSKIVWKGKRTMTQKRNQNRVLYTCIILLLITGSIFLAVAFGAGRRATPKGSETLTESDEVLSSGEENDDTTGTASDKTDGQGDKETENTETDGESVKTSLTIDEIKFTSPIPDGAVLVKCSLSVPVYSLTMNDYRVHTGIDITAENASAVLCCADGTVTSVFDDPMMGMTVVVTHAEGVESVYKNLSEELSEGITAGKTLAAGDVIGAVGDTALVECEEESHLHFELKLNGENVDPLEYITIADINEVYED